MGNISFTILKKIDGDEKQVFEYNEEFLANRLPRMVLEQLPEITITKRKFTKDEVSKAVSDAWDLIVKEFKELTVRMR
jgi:hypothetical protein